jgi:hypothetical protein
LLAFCSRSSALIWCASHGRRRAQSCWIVGLVITAGVVGLLWAGDAIDAPTAGAFAARFPVSQLINLPLFHRLRVAMAGRHLWLRAIVPTLLGCSSRCRRAGARRRQPDVDLDGRLVGYETPPGRVAGRSR